MKILLNISLFVLIFNALFSQSFALRSSDIILSDSPSIPNTEVNIKGANLIEKYVSNYKSDLLNFKASYGIQKDTIIDTAIVESESSVYLLRKIQTNKVEKDIAEKVMRDSIEQIKTRNQNLKIYLKNISLQIREETEVLQNTYIDLIIPFNNKLELLISKFMKIVQKKNLITLKDKELLGHLHALEQESIHLKNFGNMSFRNKGEVKNGLKKIVSSIREEMLAIKNLITTD